jgi:hypothetical protein
MRPPHVYLLVAEGEGFEPPRAFTLTVFKTAAIVHSAIPPRDLSPHIQSKYTTRGINVSKSCLPKTLEKEPESPFPILTFGFPYRIRSMPPMYGRSTSGTTIEASRS